MSRTESPLTKRGVELIRQGMPQNEAADLMGLAQSTLVRACQRAVPPVVIPRGRRPGKPPSLPLPPSAAAPEPAPTEA